MWSCHSHSHKAFMSLVAELRSTLGQGVVFGLDLLQVFDDLLHVEHVCAQPFLLQPPLQLPAFILRQAHHLSAR